MKLFVILIFCTALFLHAEPGYSQAERIHLTVNNVKVSDVLKEIESQTNYLFFYNHTEIGSERTVSLDVADVPLNRLLNRMFKNTDVNYVIVDKHIVLTKNRELANMAVAVQGITVTGTVTDEAGEPTPGVNVVIKGTATGVVTGFDGKYSINVPNRDAALVFSFMGYATQELVVGNRTDIDIVMSEDVQEIEEVVVIGYGSVKKQNLTTSVSKIDSKALENRPISNLGEAFQGQLAGIRAQSSSGVPGEDLVIRIRGVNTINGDSSPLYIIDGVPRDNMSDLNPSDIASIQVLKDAAATSIYGARGGNGTIVIETKTGTGKPTVTLDAYYGMQVSEKAIDMMSPKQWITYNAWRRNVEWLDSGGSMSDPMEMRPADLQIPDTWFTLEGTDWQDVITQRGSIRNYQLSASGKNDLGSIFFSGGYFDQEGIIRETYFKRFNFRLNASLNIGKKVKVGVNIAPSFANQDKRESEGKEMVIHQALLISPLVGIDQATVEWGFPTGLGSTYVNPIERLKHTTDRTKTSRILSSVWGEAELLEGLKFRTQFSYNQDVKNYEYFQPKNNNNNTTFGNSNSGTWSGWIIQNTLTYDVNIKKDHHINLLAGQSAEENNIYRIYATNSGWEFESLETLNLATNPTRAETTRDTYSSASFFGRATYEYKDKYLLTASMRYDGSSRFGANNKWGAFPSVSAGWKLNEETFLNSVNWISLLKIRASWGTSGNDRIGYYDYMAKLGKYNTSWNNGIILGMAPSNIENPDLQWESTQTTNLGFDFSGFNNRVQLNFDYYVNKTDHLLFSIPVPRTSGFTSYRTNLGSVKNRGWEIDLTTHNITGGFKWATSINLSGNKNEVTDMGGLTQSVSGNYDGQFLTKVGEPVSTFYLYHTNGLLTGDDFVLDGNDRVVSAKVPILAGQRPGNQRFVDQPTEEHPDGDGIINSSDLAPYGSNLPDLMYGITNRFSWKGFELSILLQGQIGGKVLFLMQRQVDVGAGGINQTTRWLRQWKPDYEKYYGGRGNPVPDYYGIDMSWDGETYGVYGTNNNNTDWRVYDATFLRIKNVTLSYAIPNSFLGKIRIKGMRVYFSADNLKTFTDYPGANPETNTGGNNNTQMGVDYSTYPLSKRYTLGLNLTF
ncbi:MAG: TonB-dependent receptor [Bacteroidales bacterium]|nr:TonB-dependent receptor [Bacteroidales bacterium]